MFSSHSRTRINHLRAELNNTKKKDTTAAQFFAKMKSFSSELAAAGKPIEEDDMVGYILNGLDGSYNSLVSSVNGNPGTTLDDLYSQLCAHDMRQDMLAESGRDTGFISSANAATHRGNDNNHDSHSRGDRGRSPDHGDRYGADRRDGGGPDRRRDDGSRDSIRFDARDGRCDDAGRDSGRRHDDGGGRCNNGRRRGRAPTPYVDITCQICKIHGHLASDCWWRYQDGSDDDDHDDKAATLSPPHAPAGFPAGSGPNSDVSSQSSPATSPSAHASGAGSRDDSAESAPLGSSAPNTAAAPIVSGIQTRLSKGIRNPKIYKDGTIRVVVVNKQMP